MQIVIEIPESVKQAFDNATEDDIYGCYYDYNSIIGRAIKNGVPTEPCEDAISRQALLEAFNLSEKTRKYGGDHSGYDTMMLYEIQDVIEDLPSVTPTCSEKPNNCTACILDGTDACSRGAGRAVDGRVCEDFVGESEDRSR